MPEQDAYVALLVRLWGTVPEEVAEIAKTLRSDPDLLSAMSADASPGPSDTQAG